MFDEAWLNGTHSVIKNGAYRWLNFDGENHRTDGPAVVWPDKYAEWWIDGKQHREDGPAVVLTNGSQEWYVGGELHRTDGPAISYANGTQEWWVDGRRHRADGPAVVRPDCAPLWYLCGRMVSQEQSNQFCKLPETLREHVEDRLLDGTCFDEAVVEVSAASS